MKTSNNAIELIKQFEGLRLISYLCPAGVATIGYGHTRNIKMGMKIDESQANILLGMDTLECEKIISKYVKAELNQNQFDALIDFVFNIGETKFKNSTLLKKLNDGNYNDAANEFLKWNKAYDPVKKIYRELSGLTKRRIREKELFTKN